jgi:beta-lactam-binding protein with PASTA domain
MKFWKFIKSKPFWMHIGIITGITLLVLVVVFQSLKLYTRHGTAISVPDLTGLTEQELDDFVDEHDFEFIIIDSVYNPEKVKGSVISQNPLPGAKVKKGRKIYLTIIAYTPEMVEMPNLKDLTSRQATAMLETYGLKVGTIKFVPDIGKTVLEQRFNGRVISPGDKVEKASSIDLTIGEGESEDKAFIPDLMGLSRDNARIAINETGLNIGAEIFDNPKDTVNVVVYKQRPSYSKESEAKLGSDIDIWLRRE